MEMSILLKDANVQKNIERNNSADRVYAWRLSVLEIKFLCVLMFIDLKIDGRVCQTFNYKISR